MSRNLKNPVRLAFLAAAALASATLAQPQPAMAFAGAAAGSPIAMLMGMALVVEPIIQKEVKCDNGCPEGFEEHFVIMEIAGFLLLDSQGSPSMSFGPLNEKDAASYGISGQERAAYNESLAEINGVAETVAAELSQDGGRVSFLRARDAWTRLAVDLDPAAASAAEKVAAGALRTTVK